MIDFKKHIAPAALALSALATLPGCKEYNFSTSGEYYSMISEQEGTISNLEEMSDGVKVTVRIFGSEDETLFLDAATLSEIGGVKVEDTILLRKKNVTEYDNRSSSTVIQGDRGDEVYKEKNSTSTSYTAIEIFKKVDITSAKNENLKNNLNNNN